MLETNNEQIVYSVFINPTLGHHQLESKNLLIRVKNELLEPLRQWLDSLEIQNPKFAKLIAKLIPAHCPFERDITLFGRKIVHIPPMCKLNPFYDQFVGLRFRALCYLVDRCGEDIQSYC
ncbi:MAG: Mo-dependent nitrogenase C-terminal domain-containing protein [Fischerella sp.]|nr:Mo-dependent nitrogenase C-terminal domain-containing protein [Fischerella sp.]